LEKYDAYRPDIHSEWVDLVGLALHFLRIGHGHLFGDELGRA
jgi:hypothetical protein